MTQIIVMSIFCLWLIVYGYSALFKKAWVLKLRNFSARVEGKDKVKPDEESTTTVTKMGNILGGMSLVLGVIGLAINIATAFVLLRGGAV